jgi:ribosomal protein S18 acetylase RimI-like enzyme
MTAPAGPPLVRPIEPRDLTWVREELVRNWGATQISSLERWHDADALPGFIATRPDGLERLGLITHTPPEPRGGCEVITLSSRVEDAGVGTALLEAAVRAAREAGCARVFLTTTNDNLRAIGFYQRRGWSLVAVHRGAVDRAREVKPTIPLVGMNGIPLRDELELELRLAPAAGKESLR